MTTEIGGATFVFDARVEGIKRGMAAVKTEFREVQKEADRVSKNSAAAMRTLGSSLANFGANADPAKVAGAWAKATGQLTTDMDRFAAEAQKQGITFAEMTQRLMYFKEESWRARRGVGDLHKVLMEYDQEAATMIRLTTTQAQREAVLMAALDRTKDSTARAKIEAAAYGLTLERTEKQASSLATGLGSMSKALGAMLTIQAAQQFTQFMISTVKSVADIGDLAANVGMTTDQVQQLQYAFAQTGLSAEDSSAGIQRFAEKLSDARKGEGELFDILNANNVALTDREGNVRSNYEVFLELAEVLKRTTNAEDALNMSVGVFGKTAGRDFLEALRQGKSALEALGEAAKNAGAVSSAELIDAADKIETRYNALMGMLEKFKQRAVVFGVENPYALIPGLGPLWNAADPMGRLTAPDPQAPAATPMQAPLTSAGGKQNLPDAIDPNKGYRLKGTGPTHDRTPDINEVDQYIKSLDEELKSLKLETETLGLSNAAKARATALAGLAADATDAQKAAALKAADAIAKQTAELDYQTNAQAMLAEETQAASEKAQDAIDAQNEALSFLSDTAQDTFSSLMDGTKSVADSFIEMAKKMVDAMLEAVVFGKGPFANLFGGAGQNGSPGGLFGSLLGGLFKAPAAPSLYEAGGTAAGDIVVGEKGPELMRVPGGTTVTPTEHVGRRVADILASAQRPAMAPIAAQAARQSSVVNFSASYNIDARGAQVGFEERLRQTLDERDKAMQRNLPAMISKARARGAI